MSPAGRPPLADARQSYRLQVMLTETERQAVETAAAAAGKPMSTWARELILAAAAQTKPAKKLAKRKSAGG